MARITHVKSAQQRYKTIPVLNEDGTPKVTPVSKKDGSTKVNKRGVPVTRKVTIEDRSQPLPNLKCGKCGKEIEPGMPYKWVATKSGPYGGSRKIRCATCPTWRQSELTGSAHRAAVLAAQETAEDEIAALDPIFCEISDLENIWANFADSAREAVESLNESANNIEDGFGHETYQSTELKERAETLEGVLDDEPSFEDFDEDSARSDAEKEVLPEYVDSLGLDDEVIDAWDGEYASALELDGFDDEEYSNLVQEKVDEAHEEWAEEQISILTDKINEADAG